MTVTNYDGYIVVMEKNCPTCNRTLPASSFHKDKRTATGLRCWCKECVREKFRRTFLGTDAYKARQEKYRADRKARVALDPKPQWITYAMGNAVQRARALGLPYSLTKEDIAKVFPDVCPLLGLRFTFATGRTTASSPTLDRKNNTLGYIPENVWVISAKANRIKSNATTEEIAMVAEGLRRHGV